MFYYQLILAIVIAAIITGLFSFVLRRTNPVGGFWIFFLMMFLISLAAGRWIRPLGPAFADVYWVPMLALAIIFALFFVVASPAKGAHKVEKRDDHEIENMPEASVAPRLFLWLFMGLLIIVVAIGFFI